MNCKVNATFYSMTKDCWTSLSPDLQKAWDILSKQNKIKILNDAMKRTNKQTSDPKHQFANVHEQEEEESSKIKANVHDSQKMPTRKPILKPSIKCQDNHMDHMGIVDLLNTPNPPLEDSPQEPARDPNEGNNYKGFNISSMFQ